MESATESIATSLRLVFDKFGISGDLPGKISWQNKAARIPEFRQFCLSLMINPENLDDAGIEALFSRWLSLFDPAYYSEYSKQHIAELISGIPKRYRNATLDALPAVRRDLMVRVIAGSSGLIAGANGTGKSSFLYLAYRLLIERGLPCIICDAQTLVHGIQTDQKNGNSFEAIVETDWMVPRLFIDELDKIPPDKDSFAIMIDLIGKRYDAGLQTVACANGTPAEIQSTISQHAYSRLTGEAEGNFGVSFTGDDMRRSGVGSKPAPRTGQKSQRESL